MEFWQCFLWATAIVAVMILYIVITYKLLDRGNFFIGIILLFLPIILGLSAGIYTATNENKLGNSGDIYKGEIQNNEI